MNDLSEFVTLHDTTLTTDSRRVAKHFGKAHKNVLRAFDNLDCSEAFRRLNFEATMADVPGPKGAMRQERIILMTKNGFVFLAMGFTGAKAAVLKERYIAAFDAMADQLQAIAVDGYRSLWDQRLELEKRDATSFMWAQFGSQRMLARRRELPSLRAEREALDTAMQPSLLETELHQ
ncbi:MULTISPECIES: Rha family transcriptional regulator [unclassified Variovorax]|uniref:Rha family transcriptional regulator n=1 Tax=unclassified Variovorax TaxID=663243 RepID=UPI00076C996E|nr:MULTISPECIES: Rha family transcriptional regulator [unclassified Variovorax]KWT72259.1 rha protein [Variovorax sp. WDL1]PNG53206.1 hypothetical protein CHC06_04552 [Variovorax sp. B2]PNG53778.1 hypothetical protein CHC07_03599 [Variovorax sp. B4]VTV11233.1 phage regulatory protein, Rha family [Variovorax sp. WDL1]